MRKKEKTHMYKQYILMRTSITCMNTTTAIEKQNKTDICSITKLNIIFDYPIIESSVVLYMKQRHLIIGKAY